MRIIILGAGRVGESVAETLVSEANDITVVDPDPERLRMLEDRLDLRGVAGNGIQPSVLRGAMERLSSKGIPCINRASLCKEAQSQIHVSGFGSLVQSRRNLRRARTTGRQPGAAA